MAHAETNSDPVMPGLEAKGHGDDEHRNEGIRAAGLEVKVEDYFDFVSPAYRHLFARAGHSPFQHPEWLSAVYSQLGRAAGAQELVITVRSPEDGNLEMVLPLVRRRVLGLKVIEFADLGVADYAAPVASRETFERLTGDPAFKASLKQVLGSHDIVRIRHIRANGLHAGLLFDGAEISAMRNSAHSIPLTGDFKQWQAKVLNRRLQKRIAKNRFALSLEGKLETRVIDCPREITETFMVKRALRARRGGSREGDDLLQQEVYFNFYLDMAIKGAAHGFARTLALKLNGRTIATLFGLTHQGRFLYLLGSADIEVYGDFTPGFLIQEDAVRLSYDLGERVFDLTIGHEPYQKKLGTVATRIDVAWQSNSLAGRLVGMAINRVEWVRHVLRRYARPI